MLHLSKDTRTIMWFDVGGAHHSTLTLIESLEMGMVDQSTRSEQKKKKKKWANKWLQSLHISESENCEQRENW